MKRSDSRQSARQHTTHLKAILKGKASAKDTAQKSAMADMPATSGQHPAPPFLAGRETALENLSGALPQGVKAATSLTNVGEHLQRPTGQMTQLVAQTNRLTQLNNIFRAFLPSYLHEHATLAHLDQDNWIVQTDSSAWATRLRYILPNLRRPLEKQLGMRIPRPRIRIAPPAIPPPSPPPPRRMTTTERTVKVLEGAARNLSDRRLEAAMMRLAEHARQRSHKP